MNDLLERIRDLWDRYDLAGNNYTQAEIEDLLVEAADRLAELNAEVAALKSIRPVTKCEVAG